MRKLLFLFCLLPSLSHAGLRSEALVLTSTEAATSLTTKFTNLPLNGGFGPQPVSTILWNKGNNIFGGLDMVASTNTFSLLPGGSPNLYGKGISNEIQMYPNFFSILYHDNSCEDGVSLFNCPNWGIDGQGFHFFNAPVFSTGYVFTDTTTGNSQTYRAPSTSTSIYTVTMPTNTPNVGNALLIKTGNKLLWETPATGSSGVTVYPATSTILATGNNLGIQFASGSIMNSSVSGLPWTNIAMSSGVFLSTITVPAITAPQFKDLNLFGGPISASVSGGINLIVGNGNSGAAGNINILGGDGGAAGGSSISIKAGNPGSAGNVGPGNISLIPGISSVLNGIVYISTPDGASTQIGSTTFISSIRASKGIDTSTLTVRGASTFQGPFTSTGTAVFTSSVTISTSLAVSGTALIGSSATIGGSTFDAAHRLRVNGPVRIDGGGNTFVTIEPTTLLLTSDQVSIGDALGASVNINGGGFSLSDIDANGLNISPGGGTVFNAISGDIIFLSDAVGEVARFKLDGKVGISTAAPVNTLAVAGGLTVTSSMTASSGYFNANNKGIFVSTFSATALTGFSIYASSGAIAANTSVTITIPNTTEIWFPMVSELEGVNTAACSIRIKTIAASSYVIYNADVINAKNYVTTCFAK